MRIGGLFLFNLDGPLSIMALQRMSYSKPCMLVLDRRQVSNLIGPGAVHSVKNERQLGLPANAILPSRICDVSNNPFAIRTNKIEQVRPAVVHLAIRQKLERSPHHRQIMIDPHQRIMNSLLDLRGSRFSYPVRKVFKSHL